VPILTLPLGGWRQNSPACVASQGILFRFSIVTPCIAYWSARGNLHLYPSHLDAIIMVNPETVIRWHRRGFRIDGSASMDLFVVSTISFRRFLRMRRTFGARRSSAPSQRYQSSAGPSSMRPGSGFDKAQAEPKRGDVSLVLYFALSGCFRSRNDPVSC